MQSDERRAAVEGVLAAVRAAASDIERRLPPVVSRLARAYCSRDGADPDAVVSTSVPMFHGSKTRYVWPDGFPGKRPLAFDFSNSCSQLFVAWELYVEDARLALELLEEVKK